MGLVGLAAVTRSDVGKVLLAGLFEKKAVSFPSFRIDLVGRLFSPRSLQRSSDWSQGHIEGEYMEADTDIPKLVPGKVRRDDEHVVFWMIPTHRRSRGCLGWHRQILSTLRVSNFLVEWNIGSSSADDQAWRDKIHGQLRAFWSKAGFTTCSDRTCFRTQGCGSSGRQLGLGAREPVADHSIPL